MTQNQIVVCFSEETSGASKSQAPNIRCPPPLVADRHCYSNFGMNKPCREPENGKDCYSTNRKSSSSLMTYHMSEKRRNDIENNPNAPAPADAYRITRPAHEYTSSELANLPENYERITSAGVVEQIKQPRPPVERLRTRGDIEEEAKRARELFPSSGEEESDVEGQGGERKPEPAPINPSMRGFDPTLDTGSIRQPETSLTPVLGELSDSDQPGTKESDTSTSEGEISRESGGLTSGDDTSGESSESTSGDDRPLSIPSSSSTNCNKYNGPDGNIGPPGSNTRQKRKRNKNKKKCQNAPEGCSVVANRLDPSKQKCVKTHIPEPSLPVGPSKESDDADVPLISSGEETSGDESSEKRGDCSDTMPLSIWFYMCLSTGTRIRSRCYRRV